MGEIVGFSLKLCLLLMLVVTFTRCYRWCLEHNPLPYRVKSRLLSRLIDGVFFGMLVASVLYFYPFDYVAYALLTLGAAGVIIIAHQIKPHPNEASMFKRWVAFAALNFAVSFFIATILYMFTLYPM